MKTGGVRITGPMTKEEKVQWDEWRERKREAERTIAELRSELDVEPDHPHRQHIVEDIEHEEKILALLSTTIAD